MSGGMCELASDLAPGTGVTLPAFSEPTRAELRGLITDLGQVSNPLDLTGAALRDETIWRGVPVAISRDPAIGLVLINWEVPATAAPSLPNTLAMIGAAHQAVACPAVIVTNVQRPMNEHGLAYLQSHGIRFALPGSSRVCGPRANLPGGRRVWTMCRQVSARRPQPRPAARATKLTRLNTWQPMGCR